MVVTKKLLVSLGAAKAAVKERIGCSKANDEFIKTRRGRGRDSIAVGKKMLVSLRAPEAAVGEFNGCSKENTVLILAVEYKVVRSEETGPAREITRLYALR